MAYFVMFLYISLSVGRVDLVKSKYGLGIAAVATVFVSLMMSIGLCSVFGVTLTLMPWEILPFMIIVVGVENINILVHAVVETSMDLPVKERVGRGLGTVGVSITMTLLAELCLLIIGAMTTIPAVQEFCTFAIAAVIMDYLLQMTFFITVISIDIRRLELSDLSIRPAVPYSRYPFSPRHPSMKTGHMSNEVEAPRFGGVHSASGIFSSEAERSRHRRSNSAASHHSDDEAKAGEKRVKANPKGRIFTSILMVGVMAYLGYLYGTTSQSIASGHDPVAISYWRILSLEDSSKFWSTVDPNHTGAYLEIAAPVVVTLMRPSNAALYGLCQDLPNAVDIEDCEIDQDVTAEPGAGAKFNDSVIIEGQLDPRRPFKLLRNALVSICLFVIWLVRVFVIPSIIIAAAILLLLSYLLSPQRKLLVDLQWRFPFIVLPGDYQSKRKLMMEELLAQEARELGQDPRPCAPLPGAVETLHQGGHKTDIDQMDISSGEGLILTSSMDGIILLWSGVAGNGRELPLARLDESSGGAKSTKPRSRSVRLLKLASSGEFAVAGYGDGSVHVWRLEPELTHPRGQWNDQVLRLMSIMELVRRPELMTDASKLRVSSACFWECPSTGDPMLQTKHRVQLLVGYRDGQVWQWDLDHGGGKCVIESKHRGGIAELAVVELEMKTRQELGLRPKTYLIAAGKDGGIQCWSNNRIRSGIQDTWALLWGHSRLGARVSISVLSLDAEVPMIAAGYSTGAIKVWDLEQGNLIWTLSRGSLSSGGLGGSPSAKHLDQGFSHQLADNHQPSHQGAITKLCFHALELEDGMTGEPAPRVWLVVSSSTDETVMVWMVEWEGMMCMPTHSGHPRLGIDPTTRRVSATLGAQTALSPTSPHGNSDSADRPASLLRTRSFGSGEPMVDSTNLSGHTDFLGMLSSSLPAPRLVGFMKQRGGKSMTASNSCLYGVRRTESSAAVVGDHGDFPKRSHASVLDATGPSSHFLRIRRKSESHGLMQSTSNHGQSPSANSSPMKRGWELWEADLYQCIFKDPGVWGLDLTVRAINLQPRQPARSQPFSSDLGLNRRQLAKGIESQSSYESGAIMVNSNGSAMAVPVLVNQDVSTLVGQETRPKLQRKPGSFTHQGGQRGYVFTTGLAKANLPQAIVSTPSSATQGSKVGGACWGDLPLDLQNNQCQPGSENGDPFLLPFVETSLVYALSRRTSRMHTVELGKDTYEDGKEPGMRDIVVGFGNFIKIVRLQDDDEEGEGNKEQNN
ncbi:sterol-sensing domain of SREBP cleavage-activation-domain-containing protein [Dissophora ornata]|nr:sterol-sensing domain of SREBP cleavage-activation-domain-containing protein [Dissophora ornata]